MKGKLIKSQRKIEVQYWSLFGQTCTVLSQRENTLRKYKVSKE